MEENNLIFFIATNTGYQASNNPHVYSYRWRLGSGTHNLFGVSVDDETLEASRVNVSEGIHEHGESRGMPSLVDVAVDRRPPVPYLVSVIYGKYPSSI